MEKLKTGTVSEEDGTDIQRLQEILGAIYQSGRILFEAGTSLKENISTIENYVRAMLSSLQFRRAARLFVVKIADLGGEHGRSEATRVMLRFK